ncbi:hypothetical protein [Nisaea sp.]|uniref:hypothetical protein n=1 Tax=Nisaea sp. TaxID=2024842 RepID=UPI003298E0EC
MDEDLQAIKKRLETKLRENSHELKEFSRERTEQMAREMKSEIGRLDMRMSGLERLIWNRLLVFAAGVFLGLAMAAIGLMLLSV